jgi:hypothetical protein
MPRFHFRVTDAEGKPRRGTMEAPSLADARALIQRRGFVVVELRAAEAEPGSMQVHANRPAARYHTGPAAARPYQPNLGERLTALIPSAPALRAGLALLALTGAVWMVVGWKTVAPNRKTDTAAKPVQQVLQQYKIVVGGRVSVQGSSALGDVQILVDLPEIPYQQTFEWAKLKHPVSNGFVAELEFQTPRRARTMIVKARKPGLGEAQTPLLHLRPGGGTFDQLQFNIQPKVR